MQKELQVYSILVAEDNLINQKVLKVLLDDKGYKTTVVSNGLEALEELNKHAFDAIIMDYQMPELDGLQTIEMIRTAYEKQVRSIPVLFLTSEINPNTLQKLAGHGIKNLLRKPFDPEHLLQSLAQLLKGKEKPRRKKVANVNYLRSITDGNKQLMAEIIGVFIEEVPANIKKMKNLCLLEDWLGLQKIVHKISSNYKYVNIEEYELTLRDFEIDLQRQAYKETYLARIIALEQVTSEAIASLELKKEKLLRKA